MKKFAVKPKGHHKRKAVIKIRHKNDDAYIKEFPEAFKKMAKPKKEVFETQNLEAKVVGIKLA